MDPRLKSGIWVGAYLLARAVKGLFGAVVRKGDETAGTVLVRINLLDGRSRLFGAVYGGSGERIWESVLKDDPASDADVEAYITRAVSRDGDLWVVEVDDRSGEAGLEGF